MNYLEPERLDALAAQYVLGTLSRAARERLARLARGNESVAAALRAWENRLLPLAESLPPVAPPERVWPALLCGTSAAEHPGARRQPGAARGFSDWFADRSGALFGSDPAAVLTRWWLRAGGDHVDPQPSNVSFPDRNLGYGRLRCDDLRNRRRHGGPALRKRRQPDHYRCREAGGQYQCRKPMVVLVHVHCFLLFWPGVRAACFVGLR